jgi:hypothetical protein
MKKWRYRRDILSLGGRGGGNVIVFNYYGASEIWPDKRNGPIGGGLLVSAQ